MNTNRFPKLVIGLALIVASLVALQAFSSPASAMKSIRSYVGMGDLHSFEALSRSSSITGMGDLPRFDARNSSSSFIGMGDLHSYEALQGIQYARKINAPSP